MNEKANANANAYGQTLAEEEYMARFSEVESGREQSEWLWGQRDPGQAWTSLCEAMGYDALLSGAGLGHDDEFRDERIRDMRDGFCARSQCKGGNHI